MTKPHPGAEVELKLLAAPRAIARLRAHRLLRGGAPPATGMLYSVYLDTPMLDLWRRGIALRLRRDGTRWTQTVKCAGTVHAGLHRRREIEAEVAGPVPDWTRIENRRLARVFASSALRTQLAPVFVTEFTRTSRVVLIAPGATVEVAIDSGEIRCGERTEPISELELELKRGAPWQLYRFALRLLQDLPLTVGTQSKAERGYALVRAKRAKPVKAPAAELTRGVSVNEAFKAVEWAGLAHLQANEHGVLADADPEYLHQVRVALRRLRSAFNVFGPVLPKAPTARVAAELKWLARALGPARDWDVFMTETLPPLMAGPGGRAALGALARACARKRREAGHRARNALASKRYQRLILSLAAWLAAEGWLARLDGVGRARLGAPVRELASAVLEKRHMRALKRGRGLARLSASELHRLRIAIKKFRYAMDFFAALYATRRARRMLRRLARLQDILGAMNDAATAVKLAGGGLRRAGAHGSHPVRQILLDWSRGRAAALRRELKVAWKAFCAAKPFW